MTPQRTTEFAVQFAAQLSAWWLLPLLLALFVGLRYLLAREMRSIGRGHAWGLFALRASVMALLLVLAFRPSLVLREILTYVGRVVVLVDDSTSMATVDAGRDPATALAIARRIDPQHQMAEDGLARAADRLRIVETRLRRFQTYSQEADRAGDAFWDRADADRSAIEEQLEEVEERLAAGVGADAEAVRDHLAAARDALEHLFAGATDPGAAAYDDCVYDLLAAARLIDAAQAVQDREALVDDDGDLAALAGRQLARSRSDTAAAAAAGIAPREDVGFELAGVIDSERRPLDAAAITTRDSVAPVDILARVEALIAEDDPFPLAGLIVVSDGRDWGPGDLESVARTSARRRVPVHVAAVGEPTEPEDIAVVDVSAPPVAVAGRPAEVRARIKVVEDRAADCTVRLVGDDGVVAEAVAAATTGFERTVTFRFAPEGTGLRRYRVVAQSRPDEAFVDRNNEAAFVVEVRENPVRVLLLDWKPRWETRFISNVLRRLSYVDLNAITLVVQKDATLQRGTGKGTWPVDEATLALYDLVILGDIPAGTLSDAEYDALERAVVERGRTLLTVGDGHRPAVPAAWAERMLPALPARADAALPPLRDLMLTPAGTRHPFTARLPLPVSRRETGPDDAAPGTTIPLAVAAEGGASVIAHRVMGAGEVLALDHPELWRRLNPRAIAGHADLVVRLVTRAAHPPRAAEAPTPGLRLEAHNYRTSDRIQAWVADPPRAEARVAALRDGESMATARSQEAVAGAPAGRTVLPHLPAGTYRFSVDGEAVGSDPVHVIDDNPELTWLRRDDELLTALAAETGGTLRGVQELPRLVERIEPVSRVERNERTWRAWTSTVFLALVTCLLAVEWVWRKFAGLV